ncbi:MAG TPA: PAS domain-containing protein [Terriglobia bacterium]|nr:PAS domain-containing protein [Terriglobia bacterium]
MRIEQSFGFQPLTERPQRLFDAWDRWRGKRSMPARRDVLPEELRDLLPYVALMQANPDPLECRYIVSGNAVDRASERGIRGMTIREVLAMGSPSIDDEIAAIYGGVINGGTPHFSSGSMEYRDRGFITFDRALLPLSPDDHAVDYLLCGFFYNFA